MPWEKRFDENSALDAAMQLFWERGYRAVSMADLVAELGVNRSSLYNTFGQKDDLFRLALERYDRVHREEWLAGLSTRLAPIDSIRQAFTDIVETPDERRRFGCLLVNTTLDAPSGDVDELVRRAFDSTEAFFGRQLELAAADGDLPADIDCAAAAAALMALFLGIRVLSRAQRRRDAMLPILAQVDTILHRT